MITRVNILAIIILICCSVKLKAMEGENRSNNKRPQWVTDFLNKPLFSASEKEVADLRQWLQQQEEQKMRGAQSANKEK